jgi:hypothetical protein
MHAPRRLGRTTTRLVLLVAGSAAALALVAAPTLAQTTGPSAPDQVVITGRVDVAEGETVGTVVIIDGPVSVAGTVDGDLLAVNGDVTISGTVTGTVTVINGDVTLASGALVRGDLVSQSDPTIESGATVGGDTRSVDFEFVFGRAAIVGAIVMWIGFAVSTFAFGALLLLLGPRAAVAVAAAGATAVGPSIGWGFAMLFGLPVAGGIAVATIIGIPLGIALLLALGAIYLFGAAAGALTFGRLIVKPPTSPWLALLAGWAIVMGVSLVPFLGGLAGLAVVVWGLGAITVAVWRARKVPTPTPLPAPGALPPPPA